MQYLDLIANQQHSQILCFPRRGNLTTSSRGCAQMKTNSESDSPSGYYDIIVAHNDIN